MADGLDDADRAGGAVTVIDGAGVGVGFSALVLTGIVEGGGISFAAAVAAAAAAATSSRGIPGSLRVESRLLDLRENESP